MKKAKESPLLFPDIQYISCYHSNTQNTIESTAIECKYNKVNNLKSMLTFALNALNKSLEYLMDGESVFTIQFNTCCMETLPKEHLQNVWTLLKCIEQTEVYKFTNEWG